MLETEWIPAVSGDSARLMVVLHGLGDSTAGYRWLPSALQLPWMNYLLVNAPDDYYGGYSWYDFMGDADAGIERSRQLLVALLEQQPSKGMPADQTVLFGFSQGCLMVLETGWRYPKRFAGMVGISGYVHNPGKLLADLSPVARQQRVLMTHGTYDPLIPFPGTQQQVKQLKAEGLRIEWHEFPKEHTIAGEEELQIIRRFVVDGYEERR
ncbi:MAG: serine esterase [Verrucomicrobia bacterium]|nr:serine esterase [Verrucomicrobiota bacterium]